MNPCDTIGVIVPVYNNEADLGQCVDSILAQTWPALHLYLVDDGSSDGSAGLIDEYASRFPASAGGQGAGSAGGDRKIPLREVTAIHKANEGPGLTALRGIRESTERFLCFVDADDWIDREMIEEMAARRSFGCPEVICGNYVIEKEWNRTSTRVTNALPAGEYEGERLKEKFRAGILGNEHRTVSVSRCMKLFSRELFDKAEEYADPSLRIGEDLCMTVPALLAAGRVVLLEENWSYHYRFRKKSAVHAYRRDMEAQIKLLDSAVRRILNDALAAELGREEIREMADREYYWHFFLLLKNELRNPGTAYSADKGREVSPVEYIRELCLKAKNSGLPGEAELRPEDAANRLIAFMVRRPTPARIRLIRRVFLWQASV